jgi:hypothetical protein
MYWKCSCSSRSPLLKAQKVVAVGGGHGFLDFIKKYIKIGGQYYYFYYICIANAINN